MLGSMFFSVAALVSKFFDGELFAVSAGGCSECGGVVFGGSGESSIHE